MMIYIKIISNNNVQLGGTVATKEMLDDGWFEYDGSIPTLNVGQTFALANNTLVTYTPEIAPLTQVQMYKDYLNSTDFKMLPGYVPKENENLTEIVNQRNLAREYIRANDTTKVTTGTNTENVVE